MATVIEIRPGTADREAHSRHVVGQVRWNAVRLFCAADEIAGYLRRQPDITLGELAAALVGAGFICSPDGNLAYVPHHVMLIEELETLIELHGHETRAAALFL